MSKQIVTRYVTKYALSDGIKKLEGVLFTPSGSDTYFTSEKSNEFFVAPTDYFETFEEAVIRANALRAKKIASLKKQIAKLEKLEFGGES